LLDSGTLVTGRYVIHSPLASGGSGLIYSATDRTTEKRVAIKILGPHLLHERAAREKLRLEAIVAGRVESENVVQVLDAGVDPAAGYPFLVMELLKGSDLQHWVDERGPLDPGTAFEFLRQVASGLDKAHGWKDSEQQAVPIVHRDLKPENLFLTHREDGTPLVKILDFGLAKVLSSSATMSSEIRGTPLYMAPEQISQGAVTPATDIWALGLIAFFLLSAKCYWRSGQSANTVLPAVLKEVSDGPQVSAQARLVELGSRQILPDLFNDWFFRCVNPDPAERFQSAGEAVRALGQALDVPQRSSPFNSSGTISVPTYERLAPRTDAVTGSNNSVPAVEAPPTIRYRLYWLLAVATLGILLLLFARARLTVNGAVASPSPGSARSIEDMARVSERLPVPNAQAIANSESPAPAVSSSAAGVDSTASRPIETSNVGGTSGSLSHMTRPVTGTSRPRATPSVRQAPPSSSAPKVPTAPRVLDDPADHR
jgi:eukaryotic-like serine/threonine-protein kinase